MLGFKPNLLMFDEKFDRVTHGWEIKGEVHFRIPFRRCSFHFFCFSFFSSITEKVKFAQTFERVIFCFFYNCICLCSINIVNIKAPQKTLTRFNDYQHFRLFNLLSLLVLINNHALKSSLLFARHLNEIDENKEQS